MEEYKLWANLEGLHQLLWLGLQTTLRRQQLILKLTPPPPYSAWLLVLSFGTLAHLICDQMRLVPQTLLWPLYGFTFEKVDLSHWLQRLLYALRSEPGVYLPELVGMAIIIWFVLVLVHRRKFCAFIKKGQVA